MSYFICKKQDCLEGYNGKRIIAEVGTLAKKDYTTGCIQVLIPDESIFIMETYILFSEKWTPVLGVKNKNTGEKLLSFEVDCRKYYTDKNYEIIT